MSNRLSLLKGFHMSNQELALIENNPTALNKAFGFESRPKPSIPILKINGSDDEDGTKAPKGTFVYDDGDRLLYSPEASVRAFVKGYQYRLYSATDASKNDSSIIGLSFKEEFRSMSGRLSCGKMNKKKYFELGDAVTSQQKYLQENVKCKLLLFGLVSGTFTDLDTKTETKLEDALFVWTVSQSGFMVMDNTISGISKERRAVPLTPIKLTLKKEKNGSVTFFVPIPNVTGDSVKLNITKDGEHLGKIKTFIKDTNEYVNSKYNEAIKGQGENENFRKVAKASGTIDGTAKEVDPLDLDSIPF